jgi:hypothetical protein
VAVAAAGSYGWIPVSGEMPEGEPHTLAQFCLDVLDRPKRLPRVRALEIAVLDNQATRSCAADVIHRLVDRFLGRLVLLPHRVACHGVLLLGLAGLVIRQRGKPLRCMGRARWCSFFAGISEPGLLPWDEDWHPV